MTCNTFNNLEFKRLPSLNRILYILINILIILSLPGDIRLTPEDFARAQKYCKYAGSALQYEDVSTAVQNLQKALKLLTTGRE